MDKVVTKFHGKKYFLSPSTWLECYFRFDSCFFNLLEFDGIKIFWL